MIAVLMSALGGIQLAFMTHDNANTHLRYFIAMHNMKKVCNITIAVF